VNGDRYKQANATRERPTYLSSEPTRSRECFIA